MNPPLHPMVVHFVVVGVIITALLQLAAVFSAPVRRWLGWGLPAVGVLTAVVAKIAESLGESLEHSLPPSDLIHQHAEWGDKVAAVAIGQGVLALAYWLATSPLVEQWVVRRVGVLRSRPVVLVLSVLCVLVSVAAVVLDVLAGHSGAVAVWTR